MIPSGIPRRASRFPVCVRDVQGAKQSGLPDRAKAEPGAARPKGKRPILEFTEYRQLFVWLQSVTFAEFDLKLQRQEREVGKQICSDVTMEDGLRQDVSDDVQNEPRI